MMVFRWPGRAKTSINCPACTWLKVWGKYKACNSIAFQTFHYDQTEHASFIYIIYIYMHYKNTLNCVNLSENKRLLRYFSLYMYVQQHKNKLCTLKYVALIVQPLICRQLCTQVGYFMLEPKSSVCRAVRLFATWVLSASCSTAITPHEVLVCSIKTVSSLATNMCEL